MRLAIVVALVATATPAAAQVNAGGQLDVSIPLDLPTARGGVPVPFGIGYTGGPRLGELGLGWSLDVPHVRVTSSFTGTRPRYESDPDALPHPIERVVLTYGGQSTQTAMDTGACMQGQGCDAVIAGVAAGTLMRGRVSVGTAKTRDLFGRQGRSEFTGSHIKRLKKIMKEQGFDPAYPIDIVEVNGRKIIIDGHHRARAAGAAGIQEVPVRVHEVDAATAARLELEAAQAAHELGLPF